MRTITLLLWGGLAAVAWTAPDSPTPTAPPQTGKVAVLDNHQLLEGNIERAGDQFRIRRAIGETWIPANRVIHLGPDRLDAYAYLTKRANLRDADERMRLARWCLTHSLRPQALIEAKAALALRPNDPELRQMVRALEQISVQSPRPEPMPTNTAVQPANFVEEAPTPPDFNAEAMTTFVTRIQPILMNACASCHANENTKGFKLVRVFEGNLNRRSTQHNLVATLTQIHREDIAQSPLLVKALLPHGDSPKAPIRDRQMPMYQLLESWVRFAVIRPDYVPNEPLPPAPAPMSVTTTPEAMPPMGFAPVQPVPSINPTEFGLSRPAPASLPKIPVFGAPKSPPGTGDPFDPELFNDPMPKK